MKLFSIADTHRKFGRALDLWCVSDNSSGEERTVFTALVSDQFIRGFNLLNIEFGSDSNWEGNVLHIGSVQLELFQHPLCPGEGAELRCTFPLEECEDADLKPVQIVAFSDDPLSRDSRLVTQIGQTMGQVLLKVVPNGRYSLMALRPALN